MKRGGKEGIYDGERREEESIVHGREDKKTERRRKG